MNTHGQRLHQLITPLILRTLTNIDRAMAKTHVVTILAALVVVATAATQLNSYQQPTHYS